MIFIFNISSFLHQIYIRMKYILIGIATIFCFTNCGNYRILNPNNGIKIRQVDGLVLNYYLYYNNVYGRVETFFMEDSTDITNLQCVVGVPEKYLKDINAKLSKEAYKDQNVPYIPNFGITEYWDTSHVLNKCYLAKRDTNALLTIFHFKGKALQINSDKNKGLLPSNFQTLYNFPFLKSVKKRKYVYDLYHIDEPYRHIDSTLAQKLQLIPIHDKWCKFMSFYD